MAQKRRLRGIAALSAGALATVGLASGVGAADECTDDACDAPSVGWAELIQAFGGESISVEDVERIEAFYKIGGIDNPADAFINLAPLFENGDALPEDAMFKMLEAYREMGIEIPADALVGLEALTDMDGLFLRAMMDASSGGADPLTEEVKVTYDETSPQLMDVEDATSLIEEALLKMGKVEAIPEMLPEDE